MKRATSKLLVDPEEYRVILAIMELGGSMEWSEYTRKDLSLKSGFSVRKTNKILKSLESKKIVSLATTNGERP